MNNTNTTKPFVVQTQEQAVRFDELLDAFELERAHFVVSRISLAKSFGQFSNHQNAGRILAATLDLQIHYITLFLEMASVAAIWNTKFSKGKLEGGSVLDSQAKFSGKIDILRHTTNFVLRFRAVWDKIMGLLLLVYAPDAYQKFCEARRKRSFFLKQVKSLPNIPQDLVNEIDQRLKEFDGTFRTPEAHGTGVLRKWVLAMGQLQENPHKELMQHWNRLVELAIALADNLGIQKDNQLGPGGLRGPNPTPSG